MTDKTEVHMREPFVKRLDNEKRSREKALLAATAVEKGDVSMILASDDPDIAIGSIAGFLSTDGLLNAFEALGWFKKQQEPASAKT
jgi:hypothetical protein